jgi:uncharacterized protein (DUF58 family)
MRPGPRLLPAFAILFCIALLAPWVPFAAVVALSGLALLGIAFIAERILLGRISIRTERAKITALSLNEEERYSLTLATDSTRPVRLSVRQIWPRLIATRSATQSGLCNAGETLRLNFSIHSVERGREVIDPPNVSASFWGLAERLVAAGDPGEINVLPNLRAVRRLHSQLNQFALRGLGTRAAPKLGKGREFDRLREYHTDDDFRDIAWKASARHNKLIVREFRTDRSQDILLCIDRGHRMAARAGHISKVDHAVNGAVLLSYICNRMEDRMGMLAFSADVERGIGQGRGMAHMRQLTAFATGIKAEYIHTDYLALCAHVRRRLRHRSLILIMTDLPESGGRHTLVRAVRMLIPQHLPLVVVLTDPALAAAANFRPASKRELCRTLVARDVWQERKQIMLDLQRLGALVVETTPEDSGIDAINAYIDVKRRQLL